MYQNDDTAKITYIQHPTTGDHQGVLIFHWLIQTPSSTK